MLTKSVALGLTIGRGFFENLIYRWWKIVEDFHHTFLLIFAPKTHSFLEKLIGKYIKVMVFFLLQGYPLEGDKHRIKTFNINNFAKQVKGIKKWKKISKRTCNLGKYML